MSETATTPASPRHPAEVLLNLIITLLTPMFLAAAAGDPAVAVAVRQLAAHWAVYAALFPAETAASLPTFPPAERYSAAMWLGVHNEAAKEFMAGTIPPRPRPGDLGAMLRGT